MNNNDSITIHLFSCKWDVDGNDVEKSFYHVFNDDGLSLVFDTDGGRYNPSLAEYQIVQKVVYFAQLSPVIRVQIIQETIELMLNKQEQMMNDLGRLFQRLKEEQSQLQ